ncbi:cation diffusion facilitator family transporter [Marinoscillum pacificum]|uniref:cation diffusion facilitator family transporter n=1 Tax=Marinoscillum pacificum TaxID=392723 RepID=UPI0021579DD3|nr:cation diffusion facilitator family transporter [Marinoscillum pacificum]
MSNNTALGASIFGLVGNIALAILKGLAGFFGNSHALIADAIESTSDVFSSIIVLLGLRYAQKPPDENHPYGHGRIEPLITFVVVGFLIVSATLIAYQSILNIQTPHELPETWTLYILAAIIVWKEASYQIVKSKAKKVKSTTLEADAWHHRSDAITSVAAFIGISIAVFMGDGYAAADDWAALFAAFFILYNCYVILRPALGEIMDEHVHDHLVEQIRTIADTVEGIEGTEKCFIRKSGMTYHIDLHAFVDGHKSVREGHDLAHKLQDTIREQFPEAGQVLIHIEPAPST